jgi:transcriptional regulator with XRE-family HTH domain
MELAERLKKAREDTGMSVKAVAAELEVTRVQVWRMEKDADFVSVKRLKELAKLYGVPFAALFEDDLQIQETDVSYDLIGRAIELVMDVASNQTVLPAKKAIRAATVAVIRKQQARWAEDPKVKFIPQEYVLLVQDKLESNT